MKKFLSLFLLGAFLNMYSPALAKTVEVKDGTRIPITVATESTSKTVQAGQKINAIIDEDVKINDVVVFKKGDNAAIKVSDVKKAGLAGIAGEIELVNGEVIDAKGEKHTIEYSQKISGDEKMWPKVLLTTGLVIWPLLLFGFVKGGQAKINPSKIIEVSTRNDFKFTTEKL